MLHASRAAIGLVLLLMMASAIGPALPVRAGTPPAAKLRCAPVPETVFPPNVTLQVELLDAEGAPLAGREIRWERPSDAFVNPPVSVTDATGVTSAEYIFPWDAGTDDMVSVVATFAGEEAHGPASCAFEFRRISPPLPTPAPR